jgi:hypothetical protein
MKTLKFEPNLAERILSGNKTTTWRLWDDKDLKVDDEVDFINKETKEPFAKVKLTEVCEKPIGKLSKEDWYGHEEFSSEKEMYETYTLYYDKEVNPKTIVKVIHFELI